jgi:hypothetical protein
MNANEYAMACPITKLMTTSDVQVVTALNED